MNIISRKKNRYLSIFLVISGIGSLWLTYWWYILAMVNPSGPQVGSMFTIENYFILGYFILNSTLLLLLGVMFLDRKFKIGSILSIVLGILVTASLFIFPYGEGFDFFDNLFFNIIISGMVLGFPYGGTILVPMFLFGTYKGLVRGINYFRGKIDFSNT